jgi:translation initiation factor 3 subunit H
MFEELPIVIKNSHLVNVMLSELALSSNKPTTEPVHLQLGTKGSLEKCIRQMMNHVDDLNRSINSYNKYVSERQRHDALIFNLLQKRVSVPAGVVFIRSRNLTSRMIDPIVF